MRHQRQSRACDDDHRYHHVVAIEHRRARARSNREERQPHWGQPVHTRSQSASSPNGSTWSAPGHQRRSLNCAARLGQSIGIDLRSGSITTRRSFAGLRATPPRCGFDPEHTDRSRPNDLKASRRHRPLPSRSDTLSLLAMVVVMFVPRSGFRSHRTGRRPAARRVRAARQQCRPDRGYRSPDPAIRSRLATLQEGLQSIEVVKARRYPTNYIAYNSAMHIANQFTYTSKPALTRRRFRSTPNGHIFGHGPWVEQPRVSHFAVAGIAAVNEHAGSRPNPWARRARPSDGNSP